jgi:hypothetical protein
VPNHSGTEIKNDVVFRPVAEIVKFYVPSTFRKPDKRMPTEQRGKLIEFPPAHKEISLKATTGLSLNPDSPLDAPCSQMRGVGKSQLLIGVGIVIAHDPLHGPGRALISASGSYRR